MNKKYYQIESLWWSGGACIKEMTENLPGNRKRSTGEEADNTARIN